MKARRIYSTGLPTRLSRGRAVIVWRFRAIMPDSWVWRWARFWTQAHAPSGDVHVLPWNDEIAHGMGDCVCGPSTELLRCDAGHDHWMFIHHAVDGRGEGATP